MLWGHPPVRGGGNAVERWWFQANPLKGLGLAVEEDGGFLAEQVVWVGRYCAAAGRWDPCDGTSPGTCFARGEVFAEEVRVRYVARLLGILLFPTYGPEEKYRYVEANCFAVFFTADVLPFRWCD